MKRVVTPAIEYIRAARRAGLSWLEIKKNLRDAGWPDKRVIKGLRIAKRGPISNRWYVKVFRQFFQFLFRNYKWLLVIIFSVVATIWTLGVTLIFPFSFIRTQPALKDSDFEIVYKDGQKYEGSEITILASGRFGKDETFINSSVSYAGKNYLSSHRLKNEPGEGTFVYNKFNEYNSTFDSLNEKWLKIGSVEVSNFNLQEIFNTRINKTHIKRLMGFGMHKKFPVLLYEVELPLGIKDFVEVKYFIAAVSPFNFQLKYLKISGSSVSAAELLNRSAGLVSNPNLYENDRKRVSDIQNVSNQLERFYNKNKGYPKTKQGQPVFSGATADYSWPEAPSADGNCTEFYNSYWYASEGSQIGTDVSGEPIYETYKLSFCLGLGYGKYGPGPHILTPAGVESFACAERDLLCDADKSYRDLLFNPEIWQGHVLNSEVELQLIPVKDT